MHNQLKRSGLSKSSQVVQDALTAKDVQSKVLELPENTHTAEAAAQAIGCGVNEIVKSLVFRGKESGRPILILASGGSRVRESKIKAYVGEKIERADPKFVREVTGFAIGGIPPLGHKEPLLTIIDEDLLNHKTIWAAGGTPHTVFSLQAKDLPHITGGNIESIA